MKQTNLKKEILVYAHWIGLKKPEIIGTLNSSFIRGKEIFLFNYSKEWLSGENYELLDPDLMFFSGAQYLPENKTNFGLFLDSSPDRWGRLLMRRREAIHARQENRKSKTLTETEYLLGVQDEQRMGGIRFKLEEEGSFLSSEKELTVPAWTYIKDLQHAADLLESDKDLDDPEYQKWINILIAPGSSLGGSRPKAGIKDKKGHLWIAKFPSRNDNKDIGAWEFIVHQLAFSAGIEVPPAEAKIFLGRHHTFLVKRFDRNNLGERIHYASSMTALGYTDGTDFSDGVSYLEIAEFLSKKSAEPLKDLEQLWRRIVFNICVKNSDDHLRNHAFLLSERGWRLSPSYDMNPIETASGLSLNISENDNSLNLELALETAGYYRLSLRQGKKIIMEIQNAVSSWRKLAKKLKLSKDEIEMTSPAFLNLY